jgi:tryptophanase
VYIDAGSFLPRIPPQAFPGQALACAFYEQGGIRGVEIGSLMFGTNAPAARHEGATHLELLRLAIPRRVYTKSHIDYVLEAAAEVVESRESIHGLRIVEEAPYLRHFTARLAPLETKRAAV